MSVQRTDYDLLRRVGGRIASFRAAAGLAQAELAEQVGVEPVSLSRWETGSRSPSITVLYGIAQALAVGVGDLVDDSQGGQAEAEPGVLALERVMARASPEQRDLVARIAMEVLKPT